LHAFCVLCVLYVLMCTSLRNKDFGVAGSQVWNNLPINI